MPQRKTLNEALKELEELIERHKTMRIREVVLSDQIWNAHYDRLRAEIKLGLKPPEQSPAPSKAARTKR